jgi:hypothetical protein
MRYAPALDEFGCLLLFFFCIGGRLFVFLRMACKWHTDVILFCGPSYMHDIFSCACCVSRCCCCCYFVLLLLAVVFLEEMVVVVSLGVVGRWLLVVAVAVAVVSAARCGCNFVVLRCVRAHGVRIFYIGVVCMCVCICVVDVDFLLPAGGSDCWVGTFGGRCCRDGACAQPCNCQVSVSVLF